MPETPSPRNLNPASTPESRATASPLAVVFAGIVLALLATQMITLWGSPAVIPQELADLPTTAPQEKFQEKDHATRRMFVINSATSIAMLVTAISAAATAGATWWAGSRVISLLVGLSFGAASGAIGGLSGELLLQQLMVIPEATLSPMLRVIIAQVVLWLIAGVGMAIAIRLRRRVSISRILGAVAGASVLGTVLTSLACAIAFPLAEADHIVPSEGTNRFLWAGLTAAVTIGLLIRSCQPGTADVSTSESSAAS